MKRVLLALSLVCLSNASASPKQFSAKSWIKDFHELCQHLERSYANLTWFASPQGGVDLPELHKTALRALKSAKNEREAKISLQSFVEGFHDGHLELLPGSSAPPAKFKVVLPPIKRSESAPVACAQLGFAHKKGTSFSLPFEVAAGFELLNVGEMDSFRTGIAKSNGKKLGVIRISVMREYEFPNECEKAWKEQVGNKKAGDCDSECQRQVGDRAQLLFMESLSQRLKTLSQLDVSAVLLDIRGNGGGNDLGDWIPRLFTSRDIRSARLGIVTAPDSVEFYDEHLTDINKALKAATSSLAISALKNAAKEFERLKNIALDKKKCDMSWVWRERRPWAPLVSKCSNLAFGQNYFSGAFDFLKYGALESPEAEKSLYWPTVAAPYLGSWTGPVYVAVDDRTGSAAEATAAIFQNNRAAKLIGTKTAGSGCGFMFKTPEPTLRNSRLRVRIPNCARLRSDLTDEVSGITPDIPLERFDGEADQQYALRFIEAIGADLQNN